MSSLLPVSSYAKVSAAARRSCRAGAKSRERDPVEKGCDGLKLFLRHGIKDHDEAISNPGKQVLKVVPKTIVDKGNRDLARSIESERQRADKLSRVLRTKVQRHDDAIAASGNRIKRLPSVKGLVDKGMQDIQTVASRTRRGAPLSEYSEVWTFHVTLVTYSTMVIAWASELAGAFVLWCLVHPTVLPSCFSTLRRCIVVSLDFQAVYIVLVSKSRCESVSYGNVTLLGAVIYGAVRYGSSKIW